MEIDSAAIFAVIVVLIIRGQHVPPGLGLEGLQEGLRQTVALAIGFAVSIPLYLLIHQWALRCGPWRQWSPISSEVVASTDQRLMPPGPD